MIEENKNMMFPPVMENYFRKNLTSYFSHFKVSFTIYLTWKELHYSGENLILKCPTKQANLGEW